MKTIDLLNTHKTNDFLSRDQAAELAKTALTEYTRRSKAAKDVDSAVWDMVLAGGCPNHVRETVKKLVLRGS